MVEFKFNNGNTRATREICSKLKIKTPKRRQMLTFRKLMSGRYITESTYVSYQIDMKGGILDTNVPIPIFYHFPTESSFVSIRL